MIKNILAAALVASTAFGVCAENDTMYLIKGDHVVGKYNVEDVDYATFSLPEEINDTNIWLDLLEVNKNSVAYTVNTISQTTAYAHNALSFYEVEYSARDFFDKSFDELSEEEKVKILQYCLSYNAYVAADTKTFYQKDFALDGTSSTSRFSIAPGTRHFLCAWEVSPSDLSPLDTFVYEEFTTKAPEKSSATISVELKRMDERGAVLSFEGSDVYYVQTCWSYRSAIDSLVKEYGMDFTMGMFGQNWTLEFLQDTGDLGEGIENAIWPTDGTGEYTMLVRAYDIDGDMTEYRLDLYLEEEVKDNGPKITIFSKEKGAGSVKVNFEISPSNVEEAYVRLCGENWTDDRLNMGYELHEIAMGGDAEDITSIINNFGEYTFSATGLEEEWKSLLIYGKDKEGHGTTLRINFFPEEGSDSEWSIYNPVYSAPAVRHLPAVTKIVDKRNPTLAKVQK